MTLKDGVLSRIHRDEVGENVLCLVCGLRSAVGCKPRKAVLYPDSTVAGAKSWAGPRRQKEGQGWEGSEGIQISAGVAPADSAADDLAGVDGLCNSLLVAGATAEALRAAGADGGEGHGRGASG